MASVQDHSPVVKELSDRRPQDPQPTQSLQLQTTQQTPPKPREISDSPRPHTGTSETLQESSPPRFSLLSNTQPGNSESGPPKRVPPTTANPPAFVNFPGTVSGPNNGGTGPASNVTSLGGAQNTPAVVDRNQAQPTFVPDRRQSTLYYDPIHGESATHIYRSDDGEHDNRAPPRRTSVPRPRPVFNPVPDMTANGNGNGSRGPPRAISGADSLPDPQDPAHQARTVKERLDPTLTWAESERVKYTKQARNQSMLINGAIALQVVVGAITTGVAAASTNIGAAVAVLGGISTALASYLAKARGSGEPEFSTLRSRELHTFIREVNAFVLDQGHKTGSQFDMQIMMYRHRFELIIKTEGEDSTSGTGYASHSRQNHTGGTYPVDQHGMSFGGNNFQAMPPPMNGGNGQLSEKQQMQMWGKSEKALSGMV